MSRIILLACSLFFSVSTLAADLTVSGEYVRATPPHVKNSAAFLTVTNNTDKGIKLVSVSSDIADRVELHNHVSEDGLMKMRQVQTIMINKHESESLQPGGYHVMFLGLKDDLVVGQSVNFTLYFDNGDKVEITAPVQKINMSHSTTNKKHQQ